MSWTSLALLSRLYVKDPDTQPTPEGAKARNCVWSVEIKHQVITTMHSHVKDVKVNAIIFSIFAAIFSHKTCISEQGFHRVGSQELVLIQNQFY